MPSIRLHGMPRTQSLPLIQTRKRVAGPSVRKTDAGLFVASDISARRASLSDCLPRHSGKTPQEFSVEHFATPNKDTGFFFAAAKAIDLALKDFQGENVTYNVAVLPAPEGQLYVYVLPAQTKEGVYPWRRRALHSLIGWQHSRRQAPYASLDHAVKSTHAKRLKSVKIMLIGLTLMSHVLWKNSKSLDLCYPSPNVLGRRQALLELL